MSESIPSNAAPAVDSSNAVSEAPVSQQPAAAQAAPQNQAELNAKVEEAIANGDQKTAQKLIKEFNIKVNGKAKKVSIDLNDEAAVIRQLQLAEAGQLSMQEKAKLEKVLDQHVLELRNDPWKVLAELGLDPDMLAEARIQQRIEEMQKSPEQVERENILKERDEALRKIKEIEEKNTRDRQNQLMEQAHMELENEIVEALTKNDKLPKTAKTTRRIVDAMLWAYGQGYQDVKVADILPAVEAEIKAEFDEFLANSSDDVLEYYINSKISDRFRKKRVAQAQKAPISPVSSVLPTSASVQPKQEATTKKIMKAKDYFRNLK